MFPPLKKSIFPAISPLLLPNRCPSIPQFAAIQTEKPLFYHFSTSFINFARQIKIETDRNE